MPGIRLSTLNEQWWGGAQWRGFHYANKKLTRPVAGMPVWVCGVMPEGELGVAVGFFDGFTMCLWSGTDDIFVYYWAPMYYPEPPEDVAVRMFADGGEEDG